MYLLTICEGMSHGFPAIVIPQLREQCSEFKMTKDEESWIGDINKIKIEFVYFHVLHTLYFIHSVNTNT